MDYTARWEIIGELGQGGQGKVFQVLDKKKFDLYEKEIYSNFEVFINEFNNLFKPKKEKFELFRKTIMDLMKMENPSNHGALKVLHKPDDARDAELAEERIRREIKAMSEIQHPSLLKILDFDPQSKWFVSEYHQKGTLDKNRQKFVGDIHKALRSFRPLVEGVSELHKKHQVHRDIKPQNIFLDLNDTLVLGDFGLIFFTDDRHTRISKTWENVGSRDWMPAWAQGMRIEDLKPTFDVFALGKVLWSMVSGLQVLQLWYFDTEKFNLEKIFPETPYTDHANLLFKKCIVEHEKDCLPDATSLLQEINKMLAIMNVNADFIGHKIERMCKVCGKGHYKMIIDRNIQEMQSFGIDPHGSYWRMKIFVCNHCGHVQLFAFDKEMPRAWKD
jgi:serine/threonine protein kinase